MHHTRAFLQPFIREDLLCWQTPVMTIQHTRGVFGSSLCVCCFVFSNSHHPPHYLHDQRAGSLSLSDNTGNPGGFGNTSCVGCDTLWELGRGIERHFHLLSNRLKMKLESFTNTAHYMSGSTISLWKRKGRYCTLVVCFVVVSSPIWSFILQLYT